MRRCCSDISTWWYRDSPLGTRACSAGRSCGDRAQELMAADGRRREEPVRRHVVVEHRVGRPQELELGDVERIRHGAIEIVGVRVVAGVAVGPELRRQQVETVASASMSFASGAQIRDLGDHRRPSSRWTPTRQRC